MKPLFLKISGFKSFREQQEIDFERLCTGNLFGITGNTGSGKTTVIDAVILALYGGLSKDGGATDKYKFINLQTGKAELSLTFSSSGDGKVYRVDRVYSHEASPKAELFERDDSGRFCPVVSGERAVNARVPEILGLSLKEFTQVIVLQQGEFARFLRLGTKDRSDLIGNIFSLERFGQQLSDKVGRRLKRLGSELTRLTAVITTCAAPEEKELVAREKALAESEAAFVLERERNNAARASANAELDEEFAALHARTAALKQHEQKAAQKVQYAERLNALRAEYKQALESGNNSSKLASKLANDIKGYAQAEALAAAAFAPYLKQSVSGRELLTAAAAVLAVAQREAEAEQRAQDELAAASKAWEQKQAERTALVALHSSILEEEKRCRTELEKTEQSKQQAEREYGRVAAATNLIIECCGDGAECPVCGGIIDGTHSKNITPEQREAYAQLRQSAERLTSRLGALTAQIAANAVKIESITTALEEGEKSLQILRQKAAPKESIPLQKLTENLELATKNITAREEAERGIIEHRARQEEIAAKCEVLRLQADQIKREDEAIVIDISDYEAEKKALAELEVQLKQRRTAAEQMFRKEEEAKAKELATTAAELKTQRKHLQTAAAAAAELKKVQAQYDTAERLNKLLYGKRLLNFVVNDYIKQFARVASHKLGSLKGGQYALCYDGEFCVTDNYNEGKQRGADTLSGGETFLVSLALALAISEEIADTRRFEFFFIDEGFGTLDDELRETVVDALEQLKNEHFNIGFISHSRELMERLVLKLNITAATETSGARAEII